MVADMVTAPQSHVVAYRDERLNGVVFKNETVFADSSFIEHGCTRADEAHQFVTHLLCSEKLFLTDSIQLRVTQCNKKIIGIGRIVFSDILKRDNRQTAKLRPLDIVCIYRKGNDFVIGIRTEVSNVRLRNCMETMGKKIA